MLDSLHHTSAVEHPILSKLGRNTEFTADMQVEVDQVAFSLVAGNEKIVVRFDNLSDARLLANSASRQYLKDKHVLQNLEAVLIRMNLTVYVQNRFLSILGPKANPLLRKIFYWYAVRTA
jgi:hypothetical protein